MVLTFSQFRLPSLQRLSFTVLAFALFNNVGINFEVRRFDPNFGMQGRLDQQVVLDFQGNRADVQI
jgi:hypothetical protein